MASMPLIAAERLRKLLLKLSDELVASYVASSELGLNSNKMKDDLMSTQALLHLHAAQGWEIVHNPGLNGLMQRLGEKAGEAEDVLDELQYFMIQDQLDGTQLVKPDLKVRKGHAAGHTIGKFLPWLSSSSTTTSSQPIGTKCDSRDDGDKLAFDSVSMSIRVKSVIEDTHSMCSLVSELLQIIPINLSSRTTKAIPEGLPIGPSILHGTRLYGREAVYKKTIHVITSCSETLTVLPVVGPGGIGKTTFIQHLYNDAMTEQHFVVRVWISVSTDFDVLKLTKQILACIPATEEEEEGISNAPTDRTSLDNLQISIAKRLESKRCLVVLDNVWRCNSHDEWNTLLAPFTKGEAIGNVVLVTTRFPKLSHMMKTVDLVELQGLNPEDFFALFEACIYGELNKPEYYKDDLADIARKIATKLKGSPLAAKIVGRLLRTDLSREHWMAILEQEEWQRQQHSDNIMPALKISYDYLPFHLQKCFSYCSLLPEGNMFSNLEINHFWIAVGIIDSSDLGKFNYVDELVDNGFLMRVDGKVGKNYVIHDLMHELSRIVSGQECLNISASDFVADTVPSSIRHLSITLESRYDENFREEMSKLKRRIDIANLRTLMIFGEYEERIADILKDTFNEVNSLHALFIVVKSLDDLPQNFSKLIHLEYLKLGSPNGTEITLPSTISRFYQLKFLDLEDWHGSPNLPKDISRLRNLQHFPGKKELHSSVPEVRKIKYGRELREFCVKKESLRFDLRELGELTEIGGELRIRNLEEVVTKEETSEAKLMPKRNLEKLTLGELRICNLEEVVTKEEASEAKLMSKRNLEKLTLREFCVKKESLRFDLRELGELTEIGGELRICNLEEVVTKEEASEAKLMSKRNLEKLTLVWGRKQPIIDAGILDALQPHPNLKELRIANCGGAVGPSWLCVDISLKLLEALHLEGVSWDTLPPFGQLPCLSRLILTRISGVHQLAIQDMGLLESFMISRCGNIFSGCSIEESGEGTKTMKPFPASLKKLGISSESGFESMSMLSNLTSLTHLTLQDCVKMTVDGFNPLITVNLKVLVVFNCRWDRSCPESIAPGLLSEVASSRAMPAGSFQLELLKVDTISAVLVAPICNLVASTLHTLVFCHDQRAKSLTEEQEKALQLLTSLRHLRFDSCWALQSLPGRLHRLSSLKDLDVFWCPEIRSIPKEGFPVSLRNLCVRPCSADVKEQIEKLRTRTNPDLIVSHE